MLFRSRPFGRLASLAFSPTITPELAPLASPGRARLSSLARFARRLTFLPYSPTRPASSFSTTSRHRDARSRDSSVAELTTRVRLQSPVRTRLTGPRLTYRSRPIPLRRRRYARRARRRGALVSTVDFVDDRTRLRRHFVRVRVSVSLPASPSPLRLLGRAYGRSCGRFRLKALRAFGEKTPTLTPVEL